MIGDTTVFVRINTKVTITEVSTRFNLIPWYCFNYAVLTATTGFVFHFNNILGWMLAETRTNSVVALWYHGTIEPL